MLPRLIIVLVVFAGLLSGAGKAAAQTPAEIVDLRVSFWPEYDRPAVLVIYRVQVSESVALPATLSVPMPASVGEPHAVAVRAQNGSLLLANYERVVQDDWAMLVIATDSREVQIEYYADFLIEGDRRSFSFVWPEGFQVGQVGYEVQEPIGASDLSIIPPPDGDSLHADGLRYHVAELGALPADSSLSIELGYSKATQGLTVSMLRPTQSALSRPDSTQGGSPDPMSVLPWVIAGFGALFLAGGAYALISARRTTAAGKTRRRRRRSTPASGQPRTEIQDPGGVFCHKCGTRSGAGDLFCRRCGTELRR